MAKASVASINTSEYDALIAYLREVREQAGVGQEALSKKLGQARNYVQKIEHKGRRIDVAEFCFIADALEVDPRQLFDGYLKRTGR